MSMFQVPGVFVWQGFTIENGVDFVFLRTSGDAT